MNERIRPPRDLESLLDRLKDEHVFDTKQKGMMFGAALGAWLHGRGKDLPEEVERKGEGIRIEYFQSANDDGFIDALAVTHLDGLQILAPDNGGERIELFERFALLGLRHLEAELRSDRSVRIVLEELIDKARAGEAGGHPDDVGYIEDVIFG